MLLLVAALIVACAIAWAGRGIVRELQQTRAELARRRLLDLLASFAPGVAASVTEPRALLAWQPLAATARRLFPSEFASLDAAAGAAFPFTPEQLQAAHARWTADWLAWEQAHDAGFKLKASEAEAALAASGGAGIMRARCEAVEREKLDLYQRRYEEYIRVAKALQALQTPSS